MSHWNHRVIVHCVDAGDPIFGIHEVYYEGNKIRNWTAGPVRIWADNKKEAIETLERMKRAFDKPILIEKKKRGRLTLVEYKCD